MPKLLTPEQRAGFERDGIAFPIPVMSAEEAQVYRAACDRLEADLDGKPRTIEVRQMHLHFPWACRLATHPRVLDAVEDLLGPNLLVWATELFAKHPRDPAVSIGWHRDQPYMGFDAPTPVTAWISLGPSTRENGCMQAILEADRREKCAAGVRAPKAAEAAERGAIDVVLRPGEMSLHDAYILHGSNPNLSDRKRVGFVVRFIAPEMRPKHGRPPVLLARGRDEVGHCQIVAPPSEADAVQALAEMKRSAAQHLEAMLENLKVANR